MTILSKKAKEAIMAEMDIYEEPMPAVGIFWYDPEENELFGVNKKELTPQMIEAAAEKGIPYINYPHYHRPVWLKQRYAAAAKGEESKFAGDYSQTPRGRVAWSVDRFEVLVGSWARDIEDELRVLIKKHFALPDFEFRYDEHWDLGRGWIEDDF